MASKTASLKVNADASGFKKAMGDATASVKDAAGKMGSALKSGLTNAANGAFDGLKKGLGDLKSSLGGLAGLAGGIGVGALAQKAVQSESAFRKMAFQIRAGTGEMVNWRDIQKSAQAAALKTGQSTEAIAASMSALYQEVGDADFARNIAPVVAQAATGAHESIEGMTTLAGSLNEKFGITQDQMKGSLATVVSLGNKGGVTFEDMTEKIGLIGANAKVAGLTGEKGFQQMVAMLNIADNATGTFKKGITGVSGIIDGIASGSSKMPILKAFGYDIDAAKKKGKDFSTILSDIIKKSGGKREKLAAAFSGDQLKVIQQLGDTYSQAYSSTTGDIKTKTQAGLDAYNDALKQAGKSSLSWDDIQKEAATEMESTEKRMAVAVEKLAQTFSNPAITDAINRLAEALPKLADLVSAHPIAAGAAASGVPQAVISGMLGAMFKGGAGGAAGGAAGAAASGGGVVVGGFPGQFAGDAAPTAAAGAGSKLGLGAATVGAVAGISAAAYELNELDKDMATHADDVKGQAADLAKMNGGKSFYMDVGNGEQHLMSGDGSVDFTAQATADAANKLQNGLGGNTSGMYSGQGEIDTSAFTDTGVSTLGGVEQSARDAAERWDTTHAAIASSADNAPWIKKAQEQSSVQSADQILAALTAIKEVLTPKTGAGGAATPADQSRLLAEMLASRTLKVQITNPEEVGRGGGGITSATPGNVPRGPG